MSRTVAIECGSCRRKFSGGQTERRHRYIAGDRYKCRSDQELRRRGYDQYRDGVWHRGADPNQQALTLSDTALANTPPRLLARGSDPSTSHRAAASIAPRTGTLKRLLFDAFRDSEDGLTFEEAARRVGMEPWAASKRVSDLKNDGLIVVVGERPGSSGKAQEVCAVREQVSA